jgi:hypothetical protein
LRPNLPSVLRFDLNWLEKEIRKDLTTRRAERSPRRRENLTHALAEVAAAREELSRAPDGALLAFMVSAAYRLWMNPDVEFAKTRYEKSQRSAAATNPKRHQKVVERDAQIRRRAAAMDRELSDTAKAELLARTYLISARHIRRIIQK